MFLLVFVGKTYISVLLSLGPEYGLIKSYMISDFQEHTTTCIKVLNMFKMI